MDLERAVEKAVIDGSLLLPGETVVVATSGGPDSTALLHVLAKLAPRHGWKLVAAHADHGFRGEESAREAELVAAQASALGLPFELAQLDMPARLERDGGNSQAVSRDVRYRFLLEAASRYGATKLALGHHADDQVETILMRFVRGTGVSGLAGMPARRQMDGAELIRPLLGFSKSELVDYCHNRGLAYAIDSSNGQQNYERNRFRLDVRPYLERYNPRLGDALLRLGAVVRDEDAYMEEAAAREMRGQVRWDHDRGTFDRGWFVALPSALQRRVIKLILNYLFTDHGDWEYTHVETVRLATLQGDSPNVRLSVRGDAEFVREYDRVMLVRKPAQSEDDEPEHDGFSLAPPQAGSAQEYSLPGGCSLRVRLMPAADCPNPRELGPEAAVFDWGSLRKPLYVRTWQRGDRMSVLGMQGRKLLQDLFTDSKVPRPLRKRLPVLTDAADEILWIAQIRRSSHSLVSRNTGWVLYVEYSRKESGAQAVHIMK